MHVSRLIRKMEILCVHKDTIAHIAENCWLQLNGIVISATTQYKNENGVVYTKRIV